MEKIDKTIRTPMSNLDINKYMKSMTYDQFFNGNKDIPCIILYEMMPGIGHWAMLHHIKDKNGKKCIEFFDSYGMTPDKALKIFNNKKYNPKVVKYLMNQDQQIEYSPYSFQGSNEDIMTCGRHCIVRNIFKNYNSKQYYDAMFKTSEDTGLNYDQIVSIIIP